MNLTDHLYILYWSILFQRKLSWPPKSSLTPCHSALQVLVIHMQSFCMIDIVGRQCLGRLFRVTFKTVIFSDGVMGLATSMLPKVSTKLVWLGWQVNQHQKRRILAPQTSQPFPSEPKVKPIRVKLELSNLFWSELQQVGWPEKRIINSKFKK